MVRGTCVRAKISTRQSSRAAYTVVCRKSNRRLRPIFLCQLKVNELEYGKISAFRLPTSTIPEHPHHSSTPRPALPQHLFNER